MQDVVDAGSRTKSGELEKRLKDNGLRDAGITETDASETEERMPWALSVRKQFAEPYGPVSEI